MDYSQLTENIKILIGTYQKQKAECVDNADIEGRYFAAGQVCPSACFGTCRGRNKPDQRSLSMDIKIKETGELKELEIIDPKTGCNWELDLLGHHDADMIYDDDDGVYVMDQETFDWWDDLLARYQTADYKLNETRCGVDNPESLDAYLVDMAVGSCELENYPESLTDAIDNWLEFNKKQ